MTSLVLNNWALVPDVSSGADQVTNTDTTTLGSTIMTTCQDGTISDALAVTTECEQIVIGDVEYRPTPPANMGFELPPTQNYEGGLFAVQPKIRAYNSTVSAVSVLYKFCGFCCLFSILFFTKSVIV